MRISVFFCSSSLIPPNLAHQIGAFPLFEDPARVEGLGGDLQGLAICWRISADGLRRPRDLAQVGLESRRLDSLEHRWSCGAGPG
jgi:hypothetical protein